MLNRKPDTKLSQFLQIGLYFYNFPCYNTGCCAGIILCAWHLPVAQLDRATDSDSVGRRFESCQAGQNNIIRTPRVCDIDEAPVRVSVRGFFVSAEPRIFMSRRIKKALLRRRTPFFACRPSVILRSKICHFQSSKCRQTWLLPCCITEITISLD